MEEGWRQTVLNYMNAHNTPQEVKTYPSTHTKHKSSNIPNRQKDSWPNSPLPHKVVEELQVCLFLLPHMLQRLESKGLFPLPHYQAN